MRPLHYLDTARLGPMTPAAKDAQLDFVRLSAEEPSSLYFEQFLRHGFSAWPSDYRVRFPGLHSWGGIATLKRSLRQLIHAPNYWQVLLASRSLSLVQLASSCLFRTCRNVLATDLSWPTYQHAVATTAQGTGNRVTTVPLRERILNHGWTENDVASHLVTAFSESRCDGLFLPAVDHLGIRLPIRRIVEQIQSRGELRFCFIDAAQAFCQVPLDDCWEFADFVIAGSHKWMGAYLPTGIGFFGQRRSREMFEYLLNCRRLSLQIDDPLLRFTEQLDNGNLDGHSETANLTSLFACAGAALHWLDKKAGTKSADPVSLDNAVAQVPRPATEWQPRLPDASFRSRIVLFESQVRRNQPACPELTRQNWLEAGSIVTAYPGGLARISLPH